MYPSGAWEGFWEQRGWGRQPMNQFSLHFADGKITGKGTDMIGPFTFTGVYDQQTGQIAMTKQYLGKHQVSYLGGPDGEGFIFGRWDINGWDSGEFQLRPAMHGRI